LTRTRSPLCVALTEARRSLKWCSLRRWLNNAVVVSPRSVRKAARSFLRVVFCASLSP